MASIDAQNVAKEVLENLGKGKKVKLGKILKKNGYAKNTQDNPKNVTETDSFKGIVEPVLEKMIKERDRLIEVMSGKDLTFEKHKDLVDSMDKLTKNIQLLSGGHTEKIAIDGLSEEEKEGLRGLLKK